MFGLSVKAMSWIIVVVLIVSGLAVGWKMTFGPMLMETDREINQNSHQYVDSQRSFMLQKLSAIHELEADITEATDPAVVAAKESQIKAFEREIRERMEMIDESEIPDSVREYFRE